MTSATPPKGGKPGPVLRGVDRAHAHLFLAWSDSGRLKCRPCRRIRTMKTEITVADLWNRRHDLERVIADETERGEFTPRVQGKSLSPIEEYRLRLNEIDHLLARLALTDDHEHDSGREPDNLRPRTKPLLRYRSAGATTELVRLAYAMPGIELEALVGAVYDIYRTQGMRRDVIRKIVRRLIRERYAYLDGAQLYLAEVCRKAWEASPLYGSRLRGRRATEPPGQEQ
jgi:hypothetical protein